MPKHSRPRGDVVELDGCPRDRVIIQRDQRRWWLWLHPTIARIWFGFEVRPGRIVLPFNELPQQHWRVWTPQRISSTPHPVSATFTMLIDLITKCDGLGEAIEPGAGIELERHPEVQWAAVHVIRARAYSTAQASTLLEIVRHIDFTAWEFYATTGQRPPWWIPPAGRIAPPPQPAKPRRRRLDFKE